VAPICAAFTIAAPSIRRVWIPPARVSARASVAGPRHQRGSVGEARPVSAWPREVTSPRAGSRAAVAFGASVFQKSEPGKASLFGVETEPDRHGPENLGRTYRRSAVAQ
jgi:hypothetical protein